MSAAMAARAPNNEGGEFPKFEQVAGRETGTGAVVEVSVEAAPRTALISTGC